MSFGLHAHTFISQYVLLESRECDNDDELLSQGYRWYAPCGYGWAMHLDEQMLKKFFPSGSMKACWGKVKLNVGEWMYMPSTKNELYPLTDQEVRDGYERVTVEL